MSAPPCRCCLVQVIMSAPACTMLSGAGDDVCTTMYDVVWCRWWCLHHRVRCCVVQVVMSAPPCTVLSGAGDDVCTIVYAVVSGAGGDVAESELSAGWWILHRIHPRRCFPVSPIAAQQTDALHQDGPQWRGFPSFVCRFIYGDFKNVNCKFYVVVSSKVLGLLKTGYRSQLPLHTHGVIRLSIGIKKDFV